MTSLDPSHIPRFTSHGKSSGEAVVYSRSRAGSGSFTHIPAIPDLRFEQSYLKSIAPYVQTRRISEGEDDGLEVVGFEWRKVLWITTRDQLISPLLQGAVWGFASIFIRPLFSHIGTFLGFRRRPQVPEPSNPPQPKREGELTRRLREWSSSLTSNGLETNIALAK